MADGELALDAFLAKVRKLGTLPSDAAKLAAPLIEKAARATAAAGTTPNGAPWAPKKGGGRALKDAATALSARAVGPTVVVTLKGAYVLHSIGKGHAPKREILPDGGAGIPKNMADALREASAQAFANTMGGR